MKRLWTLFGMDGADGQDLGRYGLGTVRKIEQFYHFSGIDPRGPPGQKKATRGQACGDLVWVPWSSKAASPGRTRQRVAAAAPPTESGPRVRPGMGVVNGAGAGSRGETGAAQAEVAREQQVRQQQQEDEMKKEALLRQQLQKLEEQRRQQQQVLQQQQRQQQNFDAAAAANAAAAKTTHDHSGPAQKDAQFARQAQEDLDSMLQAGGPRAVASTRSDSVEALLVFAVGLAVLAMIMQKLLRRRGRGRGGRADRLAALRRKLED